MPILPSPNRRRPARDIPRSGAPVARRAWRKVRDILIAALRWLTTGQLRQVIADHYDDPAAAAAAVADLVPWGDLVDPLADKLAEVLAPVHEAAARQVAREAGLSVGFDVTPTEAYDWARRYAAGRVVEIGEHTRWIIRDQVATGLAEGRSVDDVAADVRRTVGLHSRWAAAVNRRAGLLARDTTINPAQRKAAVEAYRDRLLDTRARTIAHTELLTASAAGRLAGYVAMVASGALTGPVEKVWLTAKDERICPVCLPLNGTTVDGLEGGWPVAGGATVLHPPAHPACRCTFLVRPRTA